jgi:hypothetical protein
MNKATTAEPLAGDRVEVAGHRVGDAPRNGEIVEVLGAAPHQHFRVRWEDDHVTLLYPGTDVVIVRLNAPSAERSI